VLKYFLNKTSKSNFSKLPIKKWKVGKEKTIRFPQVFSFIESPHTSIEKINELARTCVKDGVVQINLDQSNCEKIDYGAESVATAIALAAKEGIGLQLRGILPEDDEANRIAFATGFPRELGLTDGLPEFLNFPLKEGHRKSEHAGKSSERDRYVHQFTSYINRCLRRYDVELNQQGKAFVAGLLSEVIGNAEQHSNRDDWWIGGYLRDSPNDKEADCHVSIFNFGNPLSTSLKELPEDSKLRKDISELAHSHRFNLHYGVDQLWTLYALQAGVSRFNTGKEKIGHRGQGTAEMVKFFQSLGYSKKENRNPKMCIISGNTIINFNDNHRLKTEKNILGEDRKIIAFNKDNDIMKPPDHKNVKKLGGYFPGTLISMRFYLNRSHLKGVGKSDE